MTGLFDAMTAHVLGKVAIAAVLGMGIGFERKYWHKEAGLRTFALIAMGSALFVSLGEDVLVQEWGRSFINPTTIIGQIITGLGFLGAGLIIFHNNKLQGLTTAATIWTTAGIGAAVGLGAYGIAIASTFLMLGILIGGFTLEKSLLNLPEKH